MWTKFTWYGWKQFLLFISSLNLCQNEKYYVCVWGSTHIIQKKPSGIYQARTKDDNWTRWYLCIQPLLGKVIIAIIITSLCTYIKQKCIMCRLKLDPLFTSAVNSSLLPSAIPFSANPITTWSRLFGPNLLQSHRVSTLAIYLEFYPSNFSLCPLDCTILAYFETLSSTLNLSHIACAFLIFIEASTFPQGQFLRLRWASPTWSDVIRLCTDPGVVLHGSHHRRRAVSGTSIKQECFCRSTSALQSLDSARVLVTIS